MRHVDFICHESPLPKSSRLDKLDIVRQFLFAWICLFQRTIFYLNFLLIFRFRTVFPLPSPLPYHLSFGHVVANFVKRKIANDFFCARERAFELVFPHTPSRLSYSLCLINVGMMVGWQPRRNGTTNNKSSEIEKKNVEKKTDG